MKRLLLSIAVLLCAFSGKAYEIDPLFEKYVKEGKRQLKTLIGQNAQNDADGCSEDNFYIFSLSEDDDWSLNGWDVKEEYLNSGQGLIGSGTITDMNQRLNAFNTGSQNGGKKVYACLISKLKVAVPFDYQLGQSYDQVAETYRAIAKEHAKLKPEIAELAKDAAATIEVHDSFYQEYLGRAINAVLATSLAGVNEFLIYSHTKVAAVSSLQENKLLHRGIIESVKWIGNYFDNHGTKLVEYFKKMKTVRQEPHVKFKNGILSPIEFIENGLENEDIYPGQRFSYNSALEGEIYDPGVTKNYSQNPTDPGLYLIDFAGIINDPAAANSLNQALAQQDFLNGSKTKIYITDDDTPISLMSAIDGITANSLPDRTVMFWFHFGKAANGTQTVDLDIRMSDIYKTDLKNATTHFTTRMWDLLEEYGGTFTKDALFNYFLGINKVCKFVSGFLNKAVIPEKYWNPDHAEYPSEVMEYVVIFFDAATNPSGVMVNYFFGGSNNVILQGQIKFAFACGIWNGIVDEIKGIADMGVMITDYLIDPQKAQEFDQAIAGLSFGTIWDQIVTSHTESKYKAAFQIGKDVVFVASFFIGVGEVAAVAKAATIAKLTQRAAGLTKTTALFLNRSKITKVHRLKKAAPGTKQTTLHNGVIENVGWEQLDDAGNVIAEFDEAGEMIYSLDDIIDNPADVKGVLSNVEIDPGDVKFSGNGTPPSSSQKLVVVENNSGLPSLANKSILDLTPTLQILFNGLPETARMALRKFSPGTLQTVMQKLNTVPNLKSAVDNVPEIARLWVRHKKPPVPEFELDQAQELYQQFLAKEDYFSPTIRQEIDDLIAQSDWKTKVLNKFDQGKVLETSVSGNWANLASDLAQYATDPSWFHGMQVRIKSLGSGANGLRIYADDLFLKNEGAYKRAIFNDTKLTDAAPWTKNQRTELVKRFKDNPTWPYLEFEIRTVFPPPTGFPQGTIIRIYRQDVYKTIGGLDGNGNPTGIFQETKKVL